MVSTVLNGVEQRTKYEAMDQKALLVEVTMKVDALDNRITAHREWHDEQEKMAAEKAEKEKLEKVSDFRWKVTVVVALVLGIVGIMLKVLRIG